MIIAEIEQVRYQATGERKAVWRASYGQHSVESAKSAFFSLARLLKDYPQDTLMTCKHKGSDTLVFEPQPISHWAKWTVNDECKKSKYNAYFNEDRDK